MNLNSTGQKSELEKLNSETKAKLLAIPCQEISTSERLAQEPKASIVIITYNHEKYIAEAIESILNQKTSFAFEIIIGEDCSTDKTREIVLQYQQRYPELIRVLISAANVGTFENISRAYVRCRGQYIGVCEGDDYWTGENRLTNQVALLESRPEIGMCAGIVKVIEQEGEGYHVTKKYPLITEAHTFDFEHLMYVHTSTRLMNRPVLEHVLSYYGKIRFSESALLYIISFVRLVHVVPEEVSVYRITGKGIWTGLDQERRMLIDLNLYRECGKFLPSAQIPFCLRNEWHIKRNLLFWAVTNQKIKKIIKYGMNFFWFLIWHPNTSVSIVLQTLKKRVVRG